MLAQSFFEFAESESIKTKISEQFYSQCPINSLPMNFNILSF